MTSVETTWPLAIFQRMCMADECEAVVRFSSVVEEDNLDKLPLKDFAMKTADQLQAAPLTNVRSMTPEEVDRWRHSDPAVEYTLEEEGARLNVKIGKGVIPIKH